MEGDDLAKPKEDKGYEAVDKRKVKLGKDEEVHAEPEGDEAQPEAEAQPEGEQEAAEEGPRLPPVDVYSLLKSLIRILEAHAWQWLGLVKNPITGEMEKDLAQAKVAIDTISVLVTQLEGKLDEFEQRDLKGLISDLQINFVQQQSRP